MNSQEITAGEMTSRQRKQLITLVTDALNVAKENVASIIDARKLSDNEAQEIIEKGNLQELLQNVVADSLKQPAVIGEQFNVVILKLFSGTEKVTIDACDGAETIANATEVFPSGIDGKFNNWGTNKPSVSTKETEVQVYEMVDNAKFARMFSSLGTNLNKLCLTQAQIKNFCKKYCNWLRKEGYSTFFLFKVEDQFFVANVRVSSVGLSVLLCRFEDEDVWNSGYLPRLVVPQTNT